MSCLPVPSRPVCPRACALPHALVTAIAWLLLLGAALAGHPARAQAGEPGCRPEMAEAPPFLRRASLNADEIRLTFVGHATFLIESAAGVKAVTDYNDMWRARVTPDIATMNKAHITHYSRNPEPGITHLLPGWNPAGGRAEHDLTLLDMRVRNVPTNLRRWGGFAPDGGMGGTEIDGNSIFIFEVADLCIVHLGHLHHVLEPQHIRGIGRADVLLVPVDGSYTLDQAGMLEVMSKLQARIMVPMHFFGPRTLERFLAEAGALWPVERRNEPVMVVSRSTLPETPRVVVLPGR